LRPSSDTDQGVIAEGFYRVTGGELIVDDAKQEPIASITLCAGDDPVRIARLLLLENGDDDGFGTPISYPQQRLA